MYSQPRRYMEARDQIRRSVPLPQGNTLRYAHKGKGKPVPEGILESECIASLVHLIITT
jgi:hypothetical protein